MADFVLFGNSVPDFVKTVTGNMSRSDAAQFLFAQEIQIQNLRIDERKAAASGEAAGAQANAVAGSNPGANAAKPVIGSAMARLMAMTKGR